MSTELFGVVFDIPIWIFQPSPSRTDRRLLIRAFHRLICRVILQCERAVFVRIVLEFREALVTADRNVLALI